MSCKLLLSTLLLLTLWEYGSTLKCYFCDPDSRNGAMCDANSILLRECDQKNFGMYMDKYTKLFYKKLMAEAYNSKQRCLVIKMSERGVTSYFRSCALEDNEFCEVIEQEFIEGGVNGKCTFCETDGCNGELE